MAKLFGHRLPPPCLQAWDGQDLERKYGETHLVLTTDADGMPRPCMLSAGEMLALDDRTLRIALWPGGHTGANLKRDGRVMICFVGPNSVFYIRGIARELSLGREPEVERFEITVESVDADAHEGMPVQHGIVFNSTEQVRREMLESWSKVLNGLRGP